MQKEINRVKRKFQILNDWDIKYVRANKSNQARVSFHPNKKKAIVYGYGKSEIPKDYFFHELLHCAFRELLNMDRRKPKDIRVAEELLIQDICKFIYKPEPQTEGDK
jgi:hypothetical protein